VVRNILSRDFDSDGKWQRYVSWYGSKKIVFTVGVAPNAPGYSTLLMYSPANRLRK
jgi:hypothetical protein